MGNSRRGNYNRKTRSVLLSCFSEKWHKEILLQWAELNYKDAYNRALEIRSNIMLEDSFCKEDIICDLNIEPLDEKKIREQRKDKRK